MAKKVKDETKKPTGLRFLLVGHNDKRLRGLLFNAGHQHTTRWDKPFDVLLFYGGPADGHVSPLLYGEKIMHNLTCPNFELDRQWVKAYHAVDPFFPKVGIGRGAHFLNVMSGGGLWQGVDGHHDPKIGHLIHDIKVIADGQVLKCPSMHTQSMIVGNGGTILASANKSTKRESMDEVNSEPNDWNDPEIIHYWNTNSLCFQGHPEEFINTKEYASLFFDFSEHYPFVDNPSV